MAAIAQLYLGLMTFFAFREAWAALGSAWRLSGPQLRFYSLSFRVCAPSQGLRSFGELPQQTNDHYDFQKDVKADGYRKLAPADRSLQ